LEALFAAAGFAAFTAAFGAAAFFAAGLADAFAGDLAAAGLAAAFGFAAAAGLAAGFFAEADASLVRPASDAAAPVFGDADFDALAMEQVPSGANTRFTQTGTGTIGSKNAAKAAA
jgi:hypothetical protein